MFGATRVSLKGDYQFSATGLSPTMAVLSRTVRLYFAFITSLTGCILLKRDPTTPIYQRMQAWQHIGLGSFAFAHHYLRNHFYFLFLRVLRCFSSPRCLLQTYIFSKKIPVKVGCPIRKSTVQRIFAPNHGLSQLITSFIGS